MTEIIRIPCGNGNSYIVTNGREAILVDTGKNMFLDVVEKACEKYEMKLIVLTHGHFDHVENAKALSEKWKVPIAMSKKDEELIASNDVQTLQAKNMLGKLVLGLSKKDFKNRKIPAFKPDISLGEGDLLKDYGIEAKIIELPGHTKGGIGVIVEQVGVIVGDALMNMFYPTVSMLYHDRKQMLESAKRISGLKVPYVFFGHGEPVKNRLWLKRI